MKVLLTGGGTLGSVSPVLAVAEEIRKRYVKEQKEVEFLWFGTWSGPEKEIVEKKGIKFYSITAGKLRRYLSMHNIWTAFFVLHGFFQSLKKIYQFKPNALVSAGSFVAVPVIWAAWFLRVPVLVHQQDYRPGLANKLSVPFASIVTVAFEKSLADFSQKKAHWVGNPVREELMKGNKERSYGHFHLEKDLPTVLVLGGGTGSLKINELIAASAPKLTEYCQIINVTGLGRNVSDSFKRFHVYQLFIDELKCAYAVADIVVTRCGLGTLSELSHLKKPAILVPMPHTHQEENIKPFIDNHAAIVLKQEELTAEGLIENIKKLLFDKEKQKELSENIGKVIKLGAAKRISDIIFEISKK